MAYRRRTRFGSYFPLTNEGISKSGRNKSFRAKPATQTYRRKSSARAVPRGGFAAPPGYRRPTSIGDAAKKALRAAANQRRAPKHHSDAASIAKDLLIDTAVKVGEKVIDNISSPSGVGKSGGSGKPAGKNPVSVSMDTKMGPTTINSAMQRVTHHAKVETGYPSTAAVKRMRKDNGHRKHTLFDTKLDDDGTTDLALNRANLTHSSGFNSRNFMFLPSAAHVTVEDVITMSRINVVGSTTPTSIWGKYYAAVMRCISEVIVYNQSAYFPMKCKIHLIKFPTEAKAGYVLHRLRNNIFNGNNSVQDADRVPRFYQHASPTTEGTIQDGNQFVNVDMSLKGSGLNLSPWFRSNCEIVKTVTKKIEPNSQINFKHVHHCGPGLDLLEVLSEFGVAGADGFETRKDPISYQIAIEVSGYPCEAVFNNGFPQPYLGTNPCYYTMEFRKQIDYVPEEVQIGNLPTIGDESLQPIKVRAFVNDPSPLGANDREIFFLPDDIVESPTSLPLGKGYVPVITDKTVVYEQSTSGRTDAGL